ncbi:MAG: hypothetical protein AcusKO_11140 [Acuticoccus sp.]
MVRDNAPGMSVPCRVLHLEAEAAVDLLRSEGVTVTAEPRTLPNGLVIAFLTDPDNYEIELV